MRPPAKVRRPGPAHKLPICASSNNQRGLTQYRSTYPPMFGPVMNQTIRVSGPAAGHWPKGPTSNCSTNGVGGPARCASGCPRQELRADNSPACSPVRSGWSAHPVHQAAWRCPCRIRKDQVEPVDQRPRRAVFPRRALLRADRALSHKIFSLRA